MKILYAASEAVPFCKTGGLADVAGSLPPALAEQGAETAVILPTSGESNIPGPKYSSPLNPKENFSNQLMANTIPQNSLLF